MVHEVCIPAVLSKRVNFNTNNQTSHTCNIQIIVWKLINQPDSVHCWLGDRKGIWFVNNLTPVIAKGLSVEYLKVTRPDLTDL